MATIKDGIPVDPESVAPDYQATLVEESSIGRSTLHMITPLSIIACGELEEDEIDVNINLDL